MTRSTPPAGDTSQNGEELVNDLVRAAADGNWFEVGSSLSKLEATVPRRDSTSTWLDVAVAATRQNKDMLRKMQRAVRFIDKQKDKATKDELRRRPLSHVDVVIRAIGLDFDHGTALLESYLESGSSYTYRRLLDAYEAIRKKTALFPAEKVRRTKSTLGEFQRVCYEVISGPAMLDLYGQICRKRPHAVSARVWKGGHPVASPYATLRRAEADPPEWDRDSRRSVGIDGVDCFVQYETDPLEVARRRMVAAATEATFFDILWLLLPWGQDASYEAIAETLAVPNLGILRIDPVRRSVATARLPFGAPVPDRRDLWDDWQRRYIAPEPAEA